MKITDIITEGREAPLYHYTSLKGFRGIIETNILKGRRLLDKHTIGIAAQPTISFTRDYNRSFIPAAIMNQSIGFRVDQSKLATRFKMQSTNQSPAQHGPEFEKGLSKPNRSTIAKMRKTGNFKDNSQYINGSSIKDLAQGTVGASARWESEEIVLSAGIPNFNTYITGIVIPRQARFSKINDLAQYLTSKIANANDINYVINTAIALGVPLLWNKQEIDPSSIKSQVLKLFSKQREFDSYR